MLKIRSSPIDGEQNAHARQCAVENKNTEFHIPARSNGNRNITAEISPQNYNQNSVQLPLPTLDLPNSGNFSENRGESQPVESMCTMDTTNDSTLGQSVNNAPNAPTEVN